MTTEERETKSAQWIKQHLGKNAVLSGASNSAKKCNSKTSMCRGFKEPDSFCPQCEHYY